MIWSFLVVEGGRVGGEGEGEGGYGSGFSLKCNSPKISVKDDESFGVLKSLGTVSNKLSMNLSPLILLSKTSLESLSMDCFSYSFPASSIFGFVLV